MGDQDRRCIITGVAGFIGFHLAKRLLEEGWVVVGIDNFNTYYDPKLKEDRNAQLETHANYLLRRGDITDQAFVRQVISEHPVSVVYHLAAQAGVRYSLEHPYEYIQANILGYMTVLEEMKRAGVSRFIYASSSSVYGDSTVGPSAENAPTDAPLSLYAATKKADELIAHAYHHLYGIACIGLRFFTVYGPWGRPDMALASFTQSIIEGKPISVFNEGKLRRDFTYIDDVVDGIIKAGASSQSWDIINIGNSQPVELLYFIERIEQSLGIEAVKNMMPAQPGDVRETYADTSHAAVVLGWKAQTSIEEGITRFINWYRSYYQL